MILYRRIQVPDVLSFDLDDTLYDNQPVLRQAEAWLDQTLKQHYPNIPRRTSFSWSQQKKQLLQQNPELRHDVGALRQAWLAKAIADAGYSGAGSKSAELIQAFIRQRSQMQLSEKMHLLLSDLGQQFKLIALTNGNIDLELAGLSDYFCYSDQAGNGTRMKPWPDMFHKAEQKTGLIPARTLHIGDSLKTDVLGARRSGWASAWLNYDFVSAKPRHRHIPAGQLPDLQLSSMEQLRLFL